MDRCGECFNMEQFCTCPPEFLSGIKLDEDIERMGKIDMDKMIPAGHSEPGQGSTARIQFRDEPVIYYITPGCECDVCEEVWARLGFVED